MNYKDIINKLPGNWNELMLKDYIKLAPVISEIEEDVIYDTDIFTKHYLTEIDKNILAHQLKARLQQYLNHLHFLFLRHYFS